LLTAGVYRQAIYGVMEHMASSRVDKRKAGDKDAWAKP
jgi:hypothetical protein